jgi:hypothetical protein
VLFRREFEFDQIYELWDFMFAAPYSAMALPKNVDGCRFSKGTEGEEKPAVCSISSTLAPFVCLSMILSKRQYIMTHLNSYDEILKVQLI